jgi:hypothetical protein
MINKSTTKIHFIAKQGIFFLTKNKQLDENFAVSRIFRTFQ